MWVRLLCGAHVVWDCLFNTGYPGFGVPVPLFIGYLISNLILLKTKELTLSWLWLWHVGFDFLSSFVGWVCVCVCVFGVRPMFLGFYRVCRVWFMGIIDLILLQTEGNYRDYHIHIFESGVCFFLT